MTTARDERESVVYLIGNADNRLVKIGTTTKGHLERLSGIQTMSPSILTVLWTTPGGVELEHRLHYRFRVERRHGEWFDFGEHDPVEKIRTAVQEICRVDPRSRAPHAAELPREEIVRRFGDGVRDLAAWLSYGGETEEVRSACAYIYILFDALALGFSSAADRVLPVAADEAAHWKRISTLTRSVLNELGALTYEHGYAVLNDGSDESAFENDPTFWYYRDAEQRGR